jgi:deoxycytidylate deaminase
MMEDIARRLEPYFKIALEEASKSPCLRRKYGAMLIYDWYGDVGEGVDEWNPWHLAFNAGVTNQCAGGICIRNRIPSRHGQNAERGAEIHAEQAILIKAGIYRLHSYLILVGIDSKTGQELMGNDCLPCHVCAVMLKWAGYRFVYYKNTDGAISPISISSIIEFREKEIEALTYG